jgi:Tfp pilus assembly protein PilZ
MVGEKGEYLTFSGNLSKSGIFIETHKRWVEKGEKIELEVRLPNGSEDVKIQGKVARIIEPNKIGFTPGFGVEFLKV